MDGAWFICCDIMRNRILVHRRTNNLNEFISSNDENGMSMMFRTATTITLTYGIITRK